jgi:hypothetical protein
MNDNLVIFSLVLLILINIVLVRLWMEVANFIGFQVRKFIKFVIPLIKKKKKQIS